MKKNIMNYFYWSFIVAILALPLGYILDGFRGLFVILVLSVLEISLSIDNAIVNASILKNWNDYWRKLFLFIGLPFAVFGMRLVFPIVIVSLTLGTDILSVLKMAIYEGDKYAEALTSIHHQISAFGGAFLLMVALEFFINQEKEKHWLHFPEVFLKKTGEIRLIETAITLTAILLTSSYLTGEHAHQLIVAGIWGIITYVFAKGVGSLLTSGDSSKIVKQGIGGLVYLELLDASFSFDGVIGAFALSHNLFIIATGLGVGAMFVRSMTIFLVDKGTLDEYHFLENGAFWAILSLAVIMFVGINHEVPEMITGLLGATFIGFSLWSSVKAKRLGRLE